MQPLLILADCNNFYVSSERVFRPDLVDRPVAVLSNNVGCIVARSQDYGELIDRHQELLSEVRG